MLKKFFIIILCSLSSMSGIFLAGLNIYTRSTLPIKESSVLLIPNRKHLNPIITNLAHTKIKLLYYKF
ncbi:hypothetical protein SCc_546 [Serratia symbiotica str. 'Cinara cedri']|nr:hypothetical protein SCc_546 [Serratia symbiotica str. 'Cinara cedri']